MSNNLKCVVDSCALYGQATYFKFPDKEKRPTERGQWLVSLGMVEVTKSARVCWRHFPSGAIIGNSKRPLLKHGKKFSAPFTKCYFIQDQELTCNIGVKMVKNKMFLDDQ